MKNNIAGVTLRRQAGWRHVLTGLAVCLGAMGTSAVAQTTLIVAADAIPHAEILEQAGQLADDLALKIIEIPNGVNPNALLAGGDVQANFFQHVPYLRTQEEALGQKFAVVATVHIEPLGLYSRRHANLRDLPDGAVVALPNNASNLSRALFLLQDQGLLRLRPGLEDPSKGLASVADIAENPRKLRISEVESPLLPRVLPDVDLAIINGNYALEAGLKPARDALALERVADNPYANVLVTSPALAQDARVTRLAEVLESPQMATFIRDRYEGSVIPVH
ncbi:MetQ/NlpA family ABC transporter substrate-binding protein [Kerstersia similis]|uniref:MetQ/NlpA family ABC transporter substrate-binding protein n=1 Tax=Kerstersia similis TaxID=206505 RepID=UPI0039EF7020